jgi:hypothetical protein
VLPRISVPGFSAPVWRRPPEPDDRIDSTRLLARIAALRDVLGDPDRHVGRLVNWRRRKGTSTRPRRPLPIRVARPPGFRRHATGGIDDILRDCHAFALTLLEAPNSS